MDLSTQHTSFIPDLMVNNMQKKEAMPTCYRFICKIKKKCIGRWLPNMERPTNPIPQSTYDESRLRRGKIATHNSPVMEDNQGQ